MENIRILLLDVMDTSLRYIALYSVYIPNSLRQWLMGNLRWKIFQFTILSGHIGNGPIGTITREIVLEDDEPRSVSRPITFLYSGDYEDSDGKSIREPGKASDYFMFIGFSPSVFSPQLRRSGDRQ